MSSDEPVESRDLATLRTVAEAATPGPWTTCGCDHPEHDTDCPNAHKNDICEFTERRPTVEVVHAYHKHAGFAVFTEAPIDPYRAMNWADATFIATFDPPTVLKLLAVVEAAAKLPACRVHSRNKLVESCPKCVLSAALEALHE